MPQANLPSESYLIQMLQSLQSQVQALAALVNYTPEEIASAGGPFTYSSNSWGALTGGAPSVTINTTSTGQLDIAIGALIEPGSNASGETAYMAVAIDGAQYLGGAGPEVSVSVGASSTASSTSYAEWVVTGLTAGVTHTITLIALVSTNGVTASYSNVTLRAQPA